MAEFSIPILMHFMSFFWKIHKWTLIVFVMLKISQSLKQFCSTDLLEWTFDYLVSFSCTVCCRCHHFAETHQLFFQQGRWNSNETLTIQSAFTENKSQKLFLVKQSFNFKEKFAELQYFEKLLSQKQLGPSHLISDLFKNM